MLKNSNNCFVVTTSARTKIRAEHKCALKMMLEIKKRNQGVNFVLVSKNKLVACCER